MAPNCSDEFDGPRRHVYGPPLMETGAKRRRSRSGRVDCGRL